MRKAIIYASVHHGNTEKLVKSIAEECQVDLIDAVKQSDADLSSYDMIGFASGIYFSKFHQSILKFAEKNLPDDKKVFLICTYGGSANYKSIEQILDKKHASVDGKFGCKGYDTFGPFKLVGGIAKGHPDDKDIQNAVEFGENKIITDLLSLVKMDKKAADVNITHMDINQLLEDILKRLRPIADRRNIDLILDCFRPVDADVDEVKFTLAVSNLVENGIKYNVDDGWVRVSLDADHKYFYITVADSGMGIPEDSIERIFERFYRVDKSHSKEIGGTGLGLAITKSSIAMHHGTIKVFSKEGEGTTFSVRIPLSYIPS